MARELESWRFHSVYLELIAERARVLKRTRRQIIEMVLDAAFQYELGKKGIVPGTLPFERADGETND